jgi:hypothetical protein
MAIPPEIRQQILQVRRDNPHLTAYMSDEQIAALLLQAELTLQVPSDLPGTEGMSAHECGVYAEQLMVSGRWQEAERFFLAQSKKSERETNLDQQAIACTSLGHLCCYRGEMAQSMTLYRRALALAERISNRNLIGS